MEPGFSTTKRGPFEKRRKERWVGKERRLRNLGIYLSVITTCSPTTLLLCLSYTLGFSVYNAKTIYTTAEIRITASLIKRGMARRHDKIGKCLSLIPVLLLLPPTFTIPVVLFCPRQI